MLLAPLQGEQPVCGGELGNVDVEIEFDQLGRSVRATDAIVQIPPRSEIRIAVGPVAAAALRPISSPSWRFSSGVVLISVTVRLYR